MENKMTKRLQILMEYKSLLINESKRAVKDSQSPEFREIIEEITNSKLLLIEDWIVELNKSIEYAFSEFSDEGRQWISV